MRPDLFVEQVRDALARLHERAYLQVHPLVPLLLGELPSGREGERLQRLLLDAIEEMRPSGDVLPAAPESRRHGYLHLRYVQGLTHEQVVQRLDISRRQGHRDHHEAVAILSNLLWSGCQRRGQPGRRESGRQDETSAPGPTTEDLLEAELRKLSQAADHPLADLSEVTDAVLRTVANLVASRQARVQVALEPELPLVTMPRDALRQALLGLLSYLLDNCAGSGIGLRAVAEGAAIRLTLTATATRPGGLSSGPDAGLAIDDSRVRVSQRLVEMQGGSIGLGEQRLARGVTLTCRLTLPAVRPTLVLVIDDDPDFGQLVQRYLHGYPYRVVLASNAERALQLAREARPQIVILDVLMPSQDGWEILQALRRLEQTSAVPVVVCSVLHDRTLAESLGATHVLAKPVSQRALLSVLLACQAMPAERPERPGDTGRARPP